jgi:hypothetical protein
MQYIVTIAIRISARQRRAVSSLYRYVLKTEIIIAIHINGYDPFVVARTFHIQRTAIYDCSARQAGLLPVIGRIKTSFDSSIAGDISDGIVDSIGADRELDKRIIAGSGINRSE